MPEYKLATEIIARSVAKTWDLAKVEWRLLNVYREDEPDTCLCGHFPIIEICEIINQRNGKVTSVGNCCVKKFLGLKESDKIFQSVRKLSKDDTKSVNIETLEHARSKNWINDWEYQFYGDIMRKRNLSEKQLRVKLAVNKKILLGVRANRNR